MKSVGIIGGYGPETTAEFYIKIMFGCQNKAAVNRPHIFIVNPDNPVQYEYDFIERNQGRDRFVSILTTAAKELENAGADFIVLPCNTLHIFIEDIRRAVNVPVLSILEETAKCIKNSGCKKVGLISTPATIENKNYDEKFMEYGLDFAIPNEIEKAQLGAIIKNLVDGKKLANDREIIHNIIGRMKFDEQIDCIALACTDLQLLNPTDDEIPVFDTMNILAESAVKYILEES